MTPEPWSRALSPRRLAGQVGLLALLGAVLPLLALGSIATVFARRSALADALAQGRQLALQGARQVHAILDGYRRSASVAATAVASLPRFDTPHARRMLRDLQLGGARDFAALDLFTLDGTPLASSRIDEATLPRASAAFLERARRAPVFDSPYVGDVLEPEVRLAVPFTVEGRLGGFLVATVRLSETWAAVAQIRVGERGRARLLGANGLELGHGDAREQAALLGRLSKGAPRATTPDELVVVSEPVSDLGWTVTIERPASEAFALARRLTWSVVILVFVVGIIAGLIAWLASRSVAAPLADLVSRARSLASHVATGEQLPKVDLKGPEDLQELASAFDAMSAEVSRAFEEARDTERLAIVARVGAGLAHDLRTPIVSVHSLGQMLLQDEHASETAKRLVPVIDRELARVHRFVERMEALAKGFRGDRPPKVPIDPGRIVQGVVDRFRAARLVPDDCELAFECPASPIKVLGHPDDMERLVENLLANAFQAMDGRKGLIRVTVAAEGGGLRLSVADQGRGIEAERLPRLFVDFRSTKRGGFGVGLAMVRRFVEEMGGTIEVQSEVGVGTRFDLCFDILTAPGQEAPSS